VGTRTGNGGPDGFPTDHRKGPLELSDPALECLEIFVWVGLDWLLWRSF